MEQIHVPTLQPGDGVSMGNLLPLKSAIVRALSEAAGARLALPPQYSPDFNSIENTFQAEGPAVRTTPRTRKAPREPLEICWTPPHQTSAPTTSGLLATSLNKREIVRLYSPLNALIALVLNDWSSHTCDAWFWHNPDLPVVARDVRFQGTAESAWATVMGAKRKGGSWP